MMHATQNVGDFGEPAEHAAKKKTAGHVVMADALYHTAPRHIEPTELLPPPLRYDSVRRIQKGLPKLFSSREGHARTSRLQAVG